jgi:hypothetical protein
VNNEIPLVGDEGVPCVLHKHVDWRIPKKRGMSAGRAEISKRRQVKEGLHVSPKA